MTASGGGEDCGEFLSVRHGGALSFRVRPFDQTPASYRSHSTPLHTCPLQTLPSGTRRPDYRQEWRQKTYYTQLRLTPLGKVEADELLAFLLGSDESLTARYMSGPGWQ